MSDDPLAPLDDLIGDIAGQLDAGARARLAREMAGDVQRAAMRRLRANRTPDGGSMPGRRPRRGDLRKKMFQRAKLSRTADAAGLTVGFAGRSARIMAVHQQGLRDRVSRAPGAPEASYPVRIVLGLSAQDRVRILDRAMSQLTSGQ